MFRKTNVICLAIFVAILFIPFLGFAGTVGNPSSVNTLRGPGAFSLKQDKGIAIIGNADFEVLFDRDIYASAASNTELTNGEWYMSSVSWVMFNRFAPYLKLGTAHLKARWTEAGQEIKLESDTNFAWGVGAKLLIWEFTKPRIKFVGDGFYRVADLDAEDGLAGGSKVALDTAKSRFLLREWQLALLAATEIDVSGRERTDVFGVSKLAPYAGIKYSDINGRIRQSLTNGDFHNPGEIEADDNFGFFAGCDIVGPNDSVLLNLEGRFIDETAFTAGLAILF